VTFANICVVNVEKSIPDKREGILKHAIRIIYIFLEVIIPILNLPNTF